MILRLILALAIITLIIALIKRLTVRRKNRPKIQTKKNSYKDTVCCHTCGIRLPKNEAIQQDSLYYCCEEHIET